MSLKKSAPPLQIELVPSKQLLVVLLLIHFGALALTVFSGSPALIQVAVIAMLLTSITVSLHKSGWNPFMPVGLGRLLHCQFITAMVWQADNTWKIFTQDGRHIFAHLLPTSTCHVHFVALNFQTEQQNWWDSRISVIIFHDAIDWEVFRQLRVRLRTSFFRDLDN